MHTKCAFIILLCILSIAPMQKAAGNENNSDDENLEEISPPPIIESIDGTDDMGTNEIPEPTVAEKMNFAKEMSLYVLGFGLVLSIFTGIIALRTKGWNREATNIFTVTIIITAGLFLMTAGYSSEQIAPMYGLLGTVVGYLLGKTRSPGDKTE